MTSTCEANKTCSATFAVTAAPLVVLNCPANQNEVACQSQAAIDTKFATWLTTVSFSGGCNAAISNNAGSAPAACGGTVTVTFTVTSTCEANKTCSATFAVTAAPLVVLNCPANQNEAACQTQAAIDTKFATWLTTVSFSGGCNAAISNNAGSAPAACGGTVTVTFTVTSTCEANKTCSATFAVTTAPIVVLNCPANQTEVACQTQAAIDTKFATWLSSATFSGGCNSAISNNNTGAPLACGGTVTVTFTVTSTCEPNKTCSATFAIASSPVSISCAMNVTEAACQSQTVINSKFNTWLSTATFSGGCNAAISNNNTGAPSACGGTVTIVFTVTSSCEAAKTCSATFEVFTATPVVLNCPVNQTETACQTQAAIDAKFATWLATVNTSGGCNPGFTNNNTGAPNACGGTTTVTFTVTSTCEPSKTCTASFGVTTATPVVLNCPVNQTEAACQTQAAIDAKFAIWLATVSTSGGCNPVFTNNNTGAPNACGGTVTVTFTVNSSCEPSKTCSASFSVANAPAVVLTCPINQTEVDCQTQAAIDAKFATWLATVSASGGCNVSLSNNNNGAPSACGGSKTVVFTASSSCESPKTCSAVFSVTGSPVIILNCPINTTEVSCQSQSGIDDKFALWLGTASFSGGCNAAISNNAGAAPSACGGTVTVTFTVTSTCEPNKTCSATFSVTTAPIVVLNCPTNQTEIACQSQAAIDTKFATWLATASFSGGCNAAISNNNNGAPLACGGAKTVTFTVTSDCEGPKTCSAIFTVSAPASIVLNCPANQTEIACQTQTAIDTKFATWLATANFSGGCNAAISNNNTGAPLACGGTVTVTFTVTSSCEPNKTCSATFSVSNSPVVVNCPINVTETACQTQATIDAKFNTWLATAGFTGGCSGNISNNNTGAPLACGGVKTVTFTVTSTCDTPKTCTATFTVATATAVVLTCPANQVELACQTQTIINSKFATWLASATFSGGCNASISNNNIGAPDACGGTVTVTFTVTSSCEPAITCSATFTVNTANPVVLSCPINQTEAACQTQAVINQKFADWIATASATGGCNISFSNNNTGAPLACGGNRTVTFTVTSSCQTPQTCSAIFTVTTAPAVVLTCPVNVTETECQSQAVIDAKFASWLTTVSFSGGCNAALSNNNNGAPLACGGVKTVTFTVTSSCEVPKTCTATFTVTTVQPVTIVCPVNVFSSNACKSQFEIDTAYANWLNSIIVTGGCNVILNNNSTGAPSECGGSKTVLFTVQSSCETTKTCSASFTIPALPPPTIFCPNAITINCDASKLPANTGTAAGQDGCGTSATVSYSDQIVAGNCTGNYIINRTWVVTDKCNTTDNCTQVITVQDNAAPTFTLPPDVTIYTAASIAGSKTIVNYDFNAGNSYLSLAPKLHSGVTSKVDVTSNVFSNITGVASGGLAFTSNPIPGKGLKVDNSFQSGYWQFNISGANLPVFTNFEVYVQAHRKGNGSATTLVMDYSTNGTTWTTFSSTNLVLGNWVECTSSIAGVSNPANLYIRVRYTGGNSNQTRELYIDNFQVKASKPYIACAFDDEPGFTGYPSNILDKCDATPSANYKDSIALADCTSKVYRTWTVYDDCGNSSTGSGKQTITIKDTSGPVVLCPTGNSLTRKADTTTCHYTIKNNEFDATASDLCFNPSTVINDYNSNSTLNGSQLTVGVHVITWLATDNCGNTSTCKFTVTIFETEPPVAHCKGDSIILDSTGNYILNVNDINNGSTDNCGIKSMKLNRYNYGCDDIPSRKVILTVTDSTGLSDTCEANLIVQDISKPTLICKNINITLPSSKTKTLKADSVILLAKDNCGIISKVMTPTVFDCKSPKVSTVTVTVKDVAGNMSTCTATVTITNTADSDCDGVWDVCDVCPGGDDKVDNDNDGKPDCKFPPIFAKVKSTWKCGTNPNKVYIAEIGADGKCTTKCVRYTDYINAPQPNQSLGPCKTCPEGFVRNIDPNNPIIGDEYNNPAHKSDENGNSAEFPFKIVPNPNYGVFDIIFESEIEEGSLQIFNLLGEEVWMYKIDKLTDHINMNSNEFKQKTAGVYRVVLKNKSSKTIQTLLIMR
ncbi:MAG: HYR domain-containing protein [Saprospiraceae bacterium]